MKINPEKIGLLIGPAARRSRAFRKRPAPSSTSTTTAPCSSLTSDAAGAEAAKTTVEALTEEVKVGKIYEGRVTSIKEFGAFIEILPGRDGLCHISELADKLRRPRG